MHTLRLGVNIDHVATVRNARGSNYPCPVKAAILAQSAGADGITAHLREDRRHISDNDISGLMQKLRIPLNLELAATEEMQEIAIRHKPHAVCIVPERREELTTESGLDVVGHQERIKNFIKPLRDAGCRVSLFVDPDPIQIQCAADVGTQVVELHTGTYCETMYEGGTDDRNREIQRLVSGANKASSLGLEVHAGHGLTYDTVKPIAAIPEIVELNIGHFLVSEAIFCGLASAVAEMRRLMEEAREVSSV